MPFGAFAGGITPTPTYPDPRIPVRGPVGFVTEGELISKALSRKALPGGTDGAAYRTRLNPVLNHSTEMAGIRGRSQAMQVQWAMLRSASSTSFYSAYLHTRLNQLDNWTGRQRYWGDTGWSIKLRDRKATPSAPQRKRAAQIQDIIDQGGTLRDRPADGRRAVWDSTYTRIADPFPRLVRRMMRDALIIGHGAIEIERSADEKTPLAWLGALDAASVRMTRIEEEGTKHVWMPPYHPMLRPKLKPADYVVVDEVGKVVREYAYGELAYLIKNPITDEWSDGYGYSDLERLVGELAGISLGIQYNREAFTENHIPPGILVLKQFTEDTRQDIERTIRSNVGGGPGKWFRLVTLLGEQDGSDATFVPLKSGAERQDMMWERYLTFLICLGSAVLQIAPEEMGFQSFVSKGGLGGENPKERIVHSMDKGLYSHLAWLEYGLTEQLVWLEDPDREFALEFENVRDRDMEKELGQARERLQNGITVVAEERAMMDLRPLRIPTDPELWEMTERAVTGIRDTLSDDDEAKDIAHQVYVEAGGRYSCIDQIPLNITMSQYVQQEIGQGYLANLHPEDAALMAQQQAMMGQGGPGGAGGEEGPPGQGGAPQGGQEGNGGQDEPTPGPQPPPGEDELDWRGMGNGGNGGDGERTERIQQGLPMGEREGAGDGVAGELMGTDPMRWFEIREVPK